MTDTTNPGVKVLLEGGSGSGKTYATAGLAESGLNVRYLMTENCIPTIIRYFADRGKPVPANIAWSYVPMAQKTFANLATMSRQINSLSYEAIAKLADANRTQHTEFIKIIDALGNFKDDRTGAVLGPADSWGNDTVLVVEGLTGLSKASMALTIGGRPVAGQQEWQIAQNNLEHLLDKLAHLQCHYVLTAHLDRETDEVTGGSKIMPATLGRKLAPKIPRFFDEVILATRNANKFVWATDATNTDLKTRYLTISGNLEPSFAPLLAKWREQATLQEAATSSAKPAMPAS